MRLHPWYYKNKVNSPKSTPANNLMMLGASLGGSRGSNVYDLVKVVNGKGGQLILGYLSNKHNFYQISQSTSKALVNPSHLY